MARIDNLKGNIHTFTLEEQSKGGKASGEARRKKGQMLKILEECLKMKSDNPMFKELPYEITTTIGLLRGAEAGNSQNYKTIVEMLGELNPEIEENKNVPTINLNIVDNSNLEKIMYEKGDK